VRIELRTAWRKSRARINRAWHVVTGLHQDLCACSLRRSPESIQKAGAEMSNQMRQFLKATGSKNAAKNSNSIILNSYGIGNLAWEANALPAELLPRFSTKYLNSLSFPSKNHQILKTSKLHENAAKVRVLTMLLAAKWQQPSGQNSHTSGAPAWCGLGELRYGQNQKPPSKPLFFSKYYTSGLSGGHSCHTHAWFMRFKPPEGPPLSYKHNRG